MMKKVVIWVVVVAVALLVVYRVIQRTGQRRSSSGIEEKGEAPVKVMIVGRFPIRDILSFTGDVKGKDQVNVYSEVPGRIRAYAVKEGEWIRKDGLIATVDRAITGLDFEPAKVRSPISGIVGRTFLDKGDAVAAQVPVALIVRMDEVEVTVNVVERDIPRVRTGQTAFVRVDAYPDTSFQGRVSTVSPVVDPTSRTAVASITISNKRGLLRPGMFARVDLVVQEQKDVLVVPADAVLGRAERYVFVVERGRAAKRALDLGIREKNRVQVTEGLNEGDTLIVVGQRVVEDGENVMIVGSELE
ncbi:MAG: efflux RND transporter periplasmic adaptor subunit [bacterium]